MTVLDNCAYYKYRGRGLDMDQHNHCRDNGNRGGRLHRDAQGAMVGIRFQRVHMRHLDHNQQRQECQTQQGRCPKSAGLPGAVLT